MYNVEKEFENLTGIYRRHLDGFIRTIIFIINDAVRDAILSKENFVELNIGIGCLSIKIEENEIKYKFVPSQSLESSVRNTVINKSNMLENKLEDCLIEKISSIYKELL